MIYSLNSVRFTPGLVLAVALAVVAPWCTATALPAIVGDATMVIGVARLTSVDGTNRTVERGASIREGDRIETGVGGHVHLRFVDGGRLSVRPSSRLQIESYSHSDQQPALNAIKFRLDEGVVRSITGAWGEAARERFRLNTPVAAIGVKGTDFVVASDADKTLASVYSGAIVLAPLSAGCQATLGPCLSGDEKLLSASMKGQMIALYRQQTTPLIIARSDPLSNSQERRTGTLADANGRADKALNADTSSRGDKALIADTNGRSDKTLNADAGRTEVATTKAVFNETSLAGVASNQIGASILPADTVAAVDPARVQQLAWGHSPWAQRSEADTLSMAFDQARQNGRQATVGNSAFTLFREVGTSTTLATAESSAQFRFSNGSAQLAVAKGGLEAARVDGGSLSIDFARATFATQLSVSSPTIGGQSLLANGEVRPNGVFIGQGGNASVAGALSLDGKEAGYFFQKVLPSGNLSGITLWGR